MSKKGEYKRRIADNTLKRRLTCKGAVLIEGAKWCGNTTTALQIAKSVLYMQLPSKKQQNLEMAELDPSLLLEGDTPRLIDEWQLAPKLWDAVRFEVDRRDDFGQFILTGSAVPASLDEISHSGIGRISRMLMRPMSLFESNDSVGDVSLASLFNGDLDIKGKNHLELQDIARIICRGGFPESLTFSQEDSLFLAQDYYDALVNSDISRVDNVRRDKEVTTRILRSYARNLGSQAKISSITKDIYANETEDLKDLSGRNLTTTSYINALKKIFVIEDSPSWNPNLRSRVAIRTSDTRYLVDPSIAASALGIGPNDLIDDLNTMGLLFENLCIRDLRVYAESLDGELYHYRDANGLECDAVIHLRNGSYGLIEIKLGGEKLINEGVENLKNMFSKIDTNKMKNPSFMMVLTATGNYAYKREDGIYIVPIGCLKD